ncbi:hypothetical protein AOQ84DRAFT_386174 [Glonium stellatum]|uniref:Uncharacterized protein n=1 Tax=Glonium stellatum TaxID=574774 RepID=A0A8E2F8R1_9PEZI|nr:hypothetical protein AOQ84DRAFT_386174 [Glonium stellatum]
MASPYQYQPYHYSASRAQQQQQPNGYPPQSSGYPPSNGYPPRQWNAYPPQHSTKRPPPQPNGYPPQQSEAYPSHQHGRYQQPNTYSQPQNWSTPPANVNPPYPPYSQVPPYHQQTTSGPISYSEQTLYPPDPQHTQQDISSHRPALAPSPSRYPHRKHGAIVSPNPVPPLREHPPHRPRSGYSHNPPRPLTAAELAESFFRHSCVPVPTEWESLPPVITIYYIEAGPKFLDAKDWLDDPRDLEYHTTPRHARTEQDPASLAFALRAEKHGGHIRSQK